MRLGGWGESGGGGSSSLQIFWVGIPSRLKDIFSFWSRRWHPTPVLLPGKSYGRRRLVGCSPWGREESDMTERLHFHFSLSCTEEGNGNPLQCSCLENPKWTLTWGCNTGLRRKLHGAVTLVSLRAIALVRPLFQIFVAMRQNRGNHKLPQHLWRCFSVLTGWNRFNLGSPPWWGGQSQQKPNSVKTPMVEEVKWKLLNQVQLFVTPWTIQSMKFSRPEYWSG